jgi:hypothetical protein
MTPVPIAAVTGAILHYKFLADFHAHAQVEAGRGEHFANGREYKEYLRVMDADAALCLKTAQSLRFSGSRQLVELGLMTSSAELDALAQ